MAGERLQRNALTLEADIDNVFFFPFLSSLKRHFHSAGKAHLCFIVLGNKSPSHKLPGPEGAADPSTAPRKLTAARLTRAHVWDAEEQGEASPAAAR